MDQVGKVVRCIEKPLLGVNASFGATAHFGKFVPLLAKHHATKVYEGVALDGKEQSASRSRRFKPDGRAPGTQQIEG
jgi:uncharacterized protein (DUF2126 family)